MIRTRAKSPEDAPESGTNPGSHRDTPTESDPALVFEYRPTIAEEILAHDYSANPATRRTGTAPAPAARQRKLWFVGERRLGIRVARGRAVRGAKAGKG